MSKLLTADYAGAKVRPSPNFGPRNNGIFPDTIILHYTGMASGALAEDRLCNIEAEVSAHYLVYENGRITQMVPEAARAWHAGASFWAGATDMNSHSIGIEISNPGHPNADPLQPAPPFEAAQISAVTALCKDIIDRWSIRPERILAHSDVAIGRKIDPGEMFPWAKLNQAGVGHYVEPSPVRGGRFFARGDSGQPVEALQSMLALYGYQVLINGDYDEVTQKAVNAFQRHFRPALIDGIADASTIETLHRLLKSIPQKEALT
ncbi:MAG: N-acetylmuramoyl-L-alanine amidase [Notoacmeibacter sp.]